MKNGKQRLAYLNDGSELQTILDTGSPMVNELSKNCAYQILMNQKLKNDVKLMQKEEKLMSLSDLPIISETQLEIR